MPCSGIKHNLGNLKDPGIIAASISSFSERESKDNWLKLIKHKIGAINWNCCCNIMFTFAITRKQAYPFLQYLGPKILQMRISLKKQRSLQSARGQRRTIRLTTESLNLSASVSLDEFPNVLIIFVNNFYYYPFCLFPAELLAIPSKV